MKKLIPLFLLLSALAVNAATTPVFLPTVTTFENAFTNTSVTATHTVVVANIFGNGKPALISANNSSSLTVLTNNGSNVFGLNATLNVGTPAYSVVAANVNGSGHVDLVCAHYNYDSLSVLTNNGSGGFLTSQTIQLKSGSEPMSVAVADIYNNGKPALISANYGSGTLTVLTNAGGGIFGSNATYSVGSEPECVVTADVNGDGYADLICANYGSGTLTVLTNNGSGGFVASETVFLKAGSEPDALTVADIYNSGKLALICANYDFSPGTLTVLTNAGGGIFGSNATYNVGSEPESVTTADVNQDGYADLICANFGSSSVIVLTNNGSGGFVAATTNGVALDPAWVAAGNIFGNGKADLITAGSGSLTVISNLTAQYTRTFTVGSLTNLSVVASGSPTPAFATTSVLPAGVTLVDNGNGTASLGGTPVIGSGGVYTLALTASNSAGVATQTVTLTVNQLPIFPGYAFGPASTNLTRSPAYALTLANLFGNGEPALICANENSTLTVLTNAGNGYFGSNATYTVGNNPESVVAADIFGSGHPALISANLNASTLTVLTNNGSGVFGLNATVTVGNEPDSVVAADIFGTGKPALICANRNANTLTVVTNNALSGFHIFATINVGSEPESLLAADVNGDGKPDLICANYNSSTISVLTNNGSGGFTSSGTITLKANTEPSSVTLADIYNNGKPALVTGNGNDTVLVLTNAGGGVFGSNATYNVNFDENLAVVAADVNEDGYVDLIFPAGDELTILTNNGAGRFALANPNAPVFVNGTVLSVVAADVNGDGRADLIYGSTGSFLMVLTNGALLKVTYTENAAGKPFTPPVAGGYPAPSLSESGALPGGVTFTAGVLSGTPNPGTPGTYNFVLTETNAIGTSTEDIALTVISAIATTPNELYTDEGISAVFTTNNLLTYDADRDGYPLSVTAVSATSTNGGTVVLNNGSYTYTPVTGFTGRDAITFTIMDSGGDMTQSTLVMLVVPPPAAQTYPLAADENTPQYLSTNALLAYDYDYGDFTVGILAVSATSTNGGMVTLDNDTGNIVYTPAAGFTGQDQFAYALADSDGGTNVGIVSVTVYPLPVAVTYMVSTPQNTPLVVPLANVLNNDSDPGGLPLSIPAVSATSTGGGTVTLDTVNGNFDYAPATGFTGQDAFTYTLADNIGGTVPGTVSVIVTHAGAPPMNTITTQLSANGTQLGLTFSGLPNQSYYIQSATNVTGPYADVPPAITADATGLVTNTITISPAPPEQFYRIRQGP